MLELREVVKKVIETNSKIKQRIITLGLQILIPMVFALMVIVLFFVYLYLSLDNGSGSGNITEPPTSISIFPESNPDIYKSENNKNDTNEQIKRYRNITLSECTEEETKEVIKDIFSTAYLVGLKGLSYTYNYNYNISNPFYKSDSCIPKQNKNTKLEIVVAGLAITASIISLVKDGLVIYFEIRKNTQKEIKPKGKNQQANVETLALNECINKIQKEEKYKGLKITKKNVLNTKEEYKFKWKLNNKNLICIYNERNKMAGLAENPA